MAEEHYFDQFDARCHSCGTITVNATVILSSILCVGFASTVGVALLLRRKRHGRMSQTLVKTICWVHTVWKDAGMRLKVKALVGLYQCVAAVPSIFNVVTPAGLDDYTMWMHILTLPSELTNVVIPGQCISETYRTRLLIGSTWPLGFLFVSTGCIVLWQLALNRRSTDAAGSRRLVRLGLQKALPLTLVVTFLFVPSAAMQAFKTFRTLPGLEPWLSDSNPLKLKTGVRILCDSVRFYRVQARKNPPIFA